MTEKELQESIDILKKTRDELNLKAFNFLSEQTKISFQELKEKNERLSFDYNSTNKTYSLDFRLIIENNLRDLFTEVQYLNSTIIHLEVLLEWLQTNSLLSDEINNHPKDSDSDIILD